MSYADDFLTAHADIMPKRARRAIRINVKIHVLKSVRDGMAVRTHADSLGLGTDWTEEAGMFILAVSGSFIGLACVQSYIDGMYRI